MDVPKLLVSRMENSPDGGGATKRGILYRGTKIVVGFGFELQ